MGNNAAHNLFKADSLHERHQLNLQGSKMR
jgi:hypothetical protein